MLNLVLLQGRLTDDPEIRYTKDNSPVAVFSLAVKRDFVSKGGGAVDFIKVTAFEKPAELVRGYVKKGQMIVVAGALKLNEYTDKGGQKRSSLQVYADKIYLVDAKREQSGTQVKGFVDVSAADDEAFDLPF